MNKSNINIIAEIGTSHEGSIEKAKELVDAAAWAGADTIKFQWVYADEILHPDTGFVKLPTGNIRLYDRFKQLECPPSFYKEMVDYVHSKGCKFCCSPFGLRSLSELLELKPDYVKVASPELNHFPMLKALASYRERFGAENVPVILSSGVSKLEDIKNAVDIVGTKNVSLLHCITSYPAPEDEYNLKVISTLANQFEIECGVSDHSLDPVLVPCLSVAVGGTVIEKHITLSRETMGLDDPVALEPEQFALMVHTVHQTEATFRHYGTELGMERTVEQLSDQFGKERVLSVLGDGIKRLAPAEEANYGRTNRSLHFMRDMKEGEIIGADDVAVLRTEKVLTPGLTPDWLDKVIGKKLLRDVTSGAGVHKMDCFAFGSQ
ncbi:N-acetylneuraminate synthase [Treponema bryantii]|uniref:N-acetylneuraminate synthase n=1 Tax=Treponema bryantii TaxID=163 RepID=A0A1H9IE67_9SPIR|nr:N-acetylneuraminate synthase family protein [Treponema bryantii]SEQ72837.1 N-acetylneuraminate synthase [Treponema bryantii]